VKRRLPKTRPAAGPLDVTEAAFREPYVGPDGGWWKIDAKGRAVPSDPPKRERREGAR
jgi:hypothetical protein